MSNYDRAHVVIQWGGTLPGGETWTNMLRGGPPGTGEDPLGLVTHGELAAWCAGHIKDAIAAWHTHASTSINAACKLAWVKANVVDMAGHYKDPTTIEYFWPTPLAGVGSSISQHPNQVTLAVSLTTDVDRGPAHRGRFYMPMPSFTLDTVNGTLTAAMALGVAGRAKVLIEALADTPGLDNLWPFKILVMSKKPSFPATHVVTGVEVGRVMDTQRRRRANQLEDWQRVAVDQGAE